MEVMQGVASSLIEAYSSFIAMLPGWLSSFVNLFLLVLVIVLYSIFVWKLYRFISRKNIIELNLKQYNRSHYAVFAKFLAIILYGIEYLLVLPFLIFFWFTIFTFFLMILVEGVIGVNTILLISATIIASIRMTAYIPGYGQKLSQEISKIFPFMLLASAILNPSFFQGDLFNTVIIRLLELPSFFSEIGVYFAFIFFLEVVLRIFEFIIELFGLEEVNVEED